MKKLSFISKSPEETKKIGRFLSRFFSAGDTLGLVGGFGAGKTTFVKGFAVGRGGSVKNVSSPSFVILKIYETRIPIFHFDFYRLKDIRDIYDIDAGAFLEDGISLIEWADHVRGFLPQEHMRFDFVSLSEHRRKITLSAFGERFQNVLSRIRKKKNEHSF